MCNTAQEWWSVNFKAEQSVLLSLTAHIILCRTAQRPVYAVNINIWACLCFLQTVTVKSQVGQETFQKNVQRKSWSPGEESSTDGKASVKRNLVKCKDSCNKSDHCMEQNEGVKGVKRLLFITQSSTLMSPLHEKEWSLDTAISSEGYPLSTVILPAFIHRLHIFRWLNKRCFWLFICFHSLLSCCCISIMKLKSLSTDGTFNDFKHCCRGFTVRLQKQDHFSCSRQIELGSMSVNTPLKYTAVLYLVLYTV